MINDIYIYKLEISTQESKEAVTSIGYKRTGRTRGEIGRRIVNNDD